MDSLYTIATIVVMGVITFALRALPFMGAKAFAHHIMVRRLGRFLPVAIMALLLLNTMLQSSTAHAQGLWVESIAVLLAIILQLFFRSALLSIFVSVALYIALRTML